MNTFFTADTHFGHNAIRKFCTRPFDDVNEMDQALIRNWNAVVQPQDVVYHLGDFAFRASDDVGSYAKRLNGKIHLILGNHDSQNLQIDSNGFESVRVLHSFKLNHQAITLCHYAMRVWPRSHRGAWHLYGHSHGKLPDDNNSLSFDVGVDCHNYYPVSFEQVEQIMINKDWGPSFID